MIVDITRKKFVKIGEINFYDTIDESTKIESNISKKPNLTGINVCDVIVNNIEGLIPHVHVVSKDKKFGCCICLHDALYFPHGKDPLTKGVFDRKQRKEFNQWMSNTNVSGNPSLTNFEYAAFLWYDYFKNDPEHVRAMNTTFRITTQPDYSNMKGDVNPNLR